MKDHDIDFERDGRLGFPEFVFGESKTIEQIGAILDAYRVRGESCLVTRVDADRGATLAGTADDLRHDPASRSLVLGEERPPRDDGVVAIVAAGTSDVPVVAECAAVLRFLGLETRLHVDKGVAGVHRLMTSLEDIAEADVVICVAGFEGALPSVLSGLVGRPVIGVPTSVGYGVAEGGMAALHAMLASCASGLVVVNIDNGFGAAIAAARILNLDRTGR